MTKGREQVKSNLRSSRLEVIREITKLGLFLFSGWWKFSLFQRAQKHTHNYVDTWFMTVLVLQSSGERMSFSINDSGSIGYSYGKNEIGALPHKRRRKKFKWIKDIDVKSRTIKLLEDHIGKYLYSLEVGKDFFNKVTKDARLIYLAILKFRTLIHQRILLKNE